MKRVKNLFVVSLLTVAMAMPVLAMENPLPMQPASQDSLADASLIFEANAQPMQLAALSQTEMKETEGAVVQFAIGGAIGGIGYGYGVYQGHYAWNTSRFLGNVGTGAFIGGTFGALGYVASGGARFVPSLTNFGANMWRANSVIMNHNVNNNAWRRN